MKNLQNSLINKMETLREGPFLTHLLELRKRLIFCFIVFGINFCVCYYFSNFLLKFFIAPLTPLLKKDASFIYTGLTEAFMTYLKVSGLSACVFSFPFWIFQLWKFIMPGLYAAERRIVLPFLYIAPVLFFSGATLAYSVVCPWAWKFLLSFENLQIPLRLEARISEYVSLTTKLIGVFGFSFQLPVVLVALCALGISSVSWLKQKRKYAFLIITIFAALFTPPDIISPLSLMFPVYGLYEFSILWGRLIHKEKKALQPL